MNRKYLHEKFSQVAKEDISVRFYEEAVGGWEGYGEFQHSQVHKQVAISFRTPRFKAIDIIEPVKIKMQLKRPSDGATSESLDFEMLPLNEGRRFWNIHRELKKRSATTDLFDQLLDDQDKHKFKYETIEVVNSLPLHASHDDVVVLDTPVEEQAKPICDANENKTIHWLENAEFIIDGNNNENNQNLINVSEDDKDLSDLLEQVAELDVIYQDHQLRQENLMLEHDIRNLDESLLKEEEMMDFDDAATYTSLQKAFKHPLSIADGPPLPPKPGQVSDGTYFELSLPPIIVNDYMSIKRESFDEEKLPPLPPKRAKKISESYNGDKENMIENNDDSNGFVRQGSIRSLQSSPRPQSQIVIKSADIRRSPSHKLPPKPTNTNTLPKQKKPGFFSKMFNRRKSKSDIESCHFDETSQKSVTFEEPEIPSLAFEINEPTHETVRNLRSLKPVEKKKARLAGKPVGRSVSSVSGKRPHLTPDVVHIPLKGDSSNSLPLRGAVSNTHLSLPGNEFYERASTASLHPIDRKTMSALQLADVPISDGDMQIVAIADAQSLRNLCEGEYGITLDPSVDLTEAEHYALYTTLAPHATESEFDEASCYYQPIEAGQILTPAEVAQRLAETL